MNLLKFNNVVFFVLLILFAGCSQSDFNDGVRYQQEGEYDKAIVSYEKAIKKNQNVALAQKNLGDIYLLRNNCEKGFDCYISSIEANHSLVLGYVLKFISDSNKTLRQTALNSLPKVQNEEARKKILDKVSLMLKSSKLHEKIDALDLIASLGCTSEPVFEDILNLLKDDNPVVRQKALVAMPLLKDCIVRFNALDEIIKVAQTDKNELVRISAIDTLGNLGYDARFALPALFDMLEADNTFSPLASKAIERIGKTDKPNVKDLKKYLYSGKNSIRVKILNIFGNMGQNANDMVPFIIPMLKDNNFDIRDTARATLRKIGTSSKEAVPDLILLLKNPEYEIRLMALTELTDIGKDASSALPSIELLLKDPNENVRKYAEYAVTEIGK